MAGVSSLVIIIYLRGANSCMQKLSNLDLFFIVQELEQLRGAFLNKVFELEPGLFRFKFRSKDYGELNLLVELGVRAHLTRLVPESPAGPSSFTATLRQHLDNARLVEARQVNADRILELEFQKEHKFFVIAELFAKGNLLFCDENKRIVRAFRREEFASRSLKGKREWIAPPNTKKSAQGLADADLNLTGQLVPALSKAVNLAPFYLEEACARAGLAFDFDSSQLTAPQKQQLSSSLTSLYDNSSPRVYFEEGKPLAFSPIALAKLNKFEFKEFDSFSLALDEYYSGSIAEKPIVKPASITRLENQLKKQEESVAEFEEKAAEFKKQADWISMNALVLDGLLSDPKKAEEKAGKLGLKAKANGLKIELEPYS